MKPVRVLDSTHVLAVCTYAAHQLADAPSAIRLTLTVTADAVVVRLAEEYLRAAALRALLQAGYAATADGEAITVSGWSSARLGERITQLDDAVQWLLDQLAVTPRKAVSCYQDVAKNRTMTGRHVRNLARQEIVRELRDEVQLRTGPLFPQASAQPGDPRTALLWRQCRWLEDEIDLLISRHRTVASQAIAEFRVEQGRTGQPEQPTRIAAEDIPARIPATGDRTDVATSTPACNADQTTAAERAASRMGRGA